MAIISLGSMTVACNHQSDFTGGLARATREKKTHKNVHLPPINGPKKPRHIKKKPKTGQHGHPLHLKRQRPVSREKREPPQIKIGIGMPRPARVP